MMCWINETGCGVHVYVLVTMFLPVALLSPGAVILLYIVLEVLKYEVT